MKYIYLILSILFISSCDPNSLFEHWMDINGDGHIDSTDTIPIVSDSLIYTCQNYFHVPGPDFVGFVANKDVIPIPPIQWWYNGEPIDLPTFLMYYGDLHLYISGINKGGTITGNVSAAQFQGRLGCVDGIGHHFAFLFIDKGLCPRGCMTFDEFFIELKAHPNFEYIEFFNTAWTCEQYNEIVDFILENCKECNFVMYLTGSNGCIPQEKIDEMILRGATIH